MQQSSSSWMSVGLLVTPLEIVQHEQSATQYATGEESKTETLLRVKVQHELVQYIKRVQYEKKFNMKRLLHKRLLLQHGNGEVWKKQHYKKNATWKNINCHSEISKNCTRIVHCSAQADNGPSVDRPFYTGSLTLYNAH